jgi:putative ABC transport system permease protein
MAQMEALLLDLRHALRTLAKAPGVALVAVVTLGLGVGVTTTVFSIVQGALLRALPFPHAERLVDIKLMRAEDRHPGMVGGGTAPLAAYKTWRTATRAFDDMATYTGDDAVLTGMGAAERVMAWHVSSNFLPLLGARLQLGRGFAADEDRPGSAAVAILSHSFWIARFGGDSAVLGRTITLDTNTYTIVGVMSSHFQYPANAAVWSNLGSVLSGRTGVRRAHEWGFWVVGRLRPGVTVAHAQDQLDVATRNAWSEQPDIAGTLPVAATLHGYLVRDVRESLWILFGATSLVLLVACANVSGLLLARGSDREREMSVRVALGAGRGRLARAVMSESLLLAAGGGLLGILLASWSVPALLALGGSELPAIQGIEIDVQVLASAVALSLGAGVLAGLIPALRVGLRPPAEALRGVAPGGLRGWRSRPAAGLVVAQVAITIVLLSGAGLLLRSFDRIIHTDPGFDGAHVVIAELHLPQYRYPTTASRAAYLSLALDRARSLPGVTDVAAASGIPFSGTDISSVSQSGISARPDQPWAWVSAVSPDYFRILGIRLLRGRPPTTASETMIDATAARTYLSGRDPLGATLGIGGSERPLTVVGIVGDTRQESLAESPPPHIYPALLPQAPAYLKILVRIAGDPGSLATAVRRELQTVDSDVPLDRVTPISSLMSDSLAVQRLYTWLLGIFAVVALLLAAAGLYGLVAYSVIRRTREIGIRIALGAQGRSVLALVMGRGLSLTAMGIVAGLAGSVAATRVLRRYLYEVTPTDPAVLGAVVVVLLCAAGLAAYVPSHRATRVDPMVALRTE